MTDHPVTQLSSWVAQQTQEFSLEFSKYVYRSYGETLSREVFTVPARTVNAEWLSDQVNKLTYEQELAFHSRVRLSNDKVCHVPLIDFIYVKSPEEVHHKLVPVNKEIYHNPTFYGTGNSLHGYYFCLLGEERWRNFLGQILLCNYPPHAGDEVVDSRWVGHSLIHGFSALRWSRKTDKYKAVPSLAGYPK
ncbi:MAG: hypothetical protein QM785_02125 [Pyrinomonadaceae bacterium]